MTESSAQRLVNSDWLEHHLSDPALRIVDTRKGDGYDARHISGAVALGGSPLLHDAGDVIAPELFAALMSRLGIGKDTLVIAYDDGNNLFAARLWWVLNYYGHNNVRVLDGGWDVWEGENRPVDSDRPAPAVASFEPQRNHALMADTDYVLDSLQKPGRQILDVRSVAEWTRTEPTDSAVPGHIPGAVHLLWTDVIDPESHRFRPRSELQRMFAQVGLSPDQEIIVYCQGGIRAAHTVFALELAGFPAVRNYEGSWSVWSRAEAPKGYPKRSTRTIESD